jgi:Uma2 family endonuclease
MVASLKDLPRPYHQLEEYYALLNVAEVPYEYWNGEILCMAGGSPEHAIICGNVFLTIGQQLKGGNCRAFNSEMPIKTPALPPFRFPDTSVVCGKPVFNKVDKFDTLINPILVVEVLSPGTAGVDRNEKKLAYQALSSVQEYVLVEQAAPHVTRFLRRGKRWQRFDYGDLQAVAELSSIQCTLPLQEVYEGIEFN